MGKTSRRIYAALVFTIAPIDGGPKLPKTAANSLRYGSGLL